MYSLDERASFLHQYDVEHIEFYKQLETLPEDDYAARAAMAIKATSFSYRRGSMLSPFTIRFELVKQYAFAIPCEEALVALSELGPIIEMGAGTGYWTYLLRKRGVDIQAYDKHVGDSNHYKFAKKWTGVLKGRPGKLKKRGNRTLFLCWPDYNTDFASNCLKRYTGETVAYIGEGGYGCTGDEAFHAALNRDWTEVKEVRIPQWEGIHDSLYIYRRGGSS